MDVRATLGTSYNECEPSVESSFGDGDATWAEMGAARARRRRGRTDGAMDEQWRDSERAGGREVLGRRGEKRGGTRAATACGRWLSAAKGKGDALRAERGAAHGEPLGGAPRPPHAPAYRYGRSPLEDKLSVQCARPG